MSETFSYSASITIRDFDTESASSHFLQYKHYVPRTSLDMEGQDFTVHPMVSVGMHAFIFTFIFIPSSTSSSPSYSVFYSSFSFSCCFSPFSFYPSSLFLLLLFLPPPLLLPFSSPPLLLRFPSPPLLPPPLLLLLYLLLLSSSSASSSTSSSSICYPSSFAVLHILVLCHNPCCTLRMVYYMNIIVMLQRTQFHVTTLGDATLIILC